MDGARRVAPSGVEVSVSLEARGQRRFNICDAFYFGGNFLKIARSLEVSEIVPFFLLSHTRIQTPIVGSPRPLPLATSCHILLSLVLSVELLLVASLNAHGGRVLSHEPSLYTHTRTSPRR